MKPLAFAVALCCPLSHLVADEPLVPPKLNDILRKIVPAMTRDEVEKTLGEAYPGAKGEMSIWSGQTGYFDYKLDNRYTLSVASITRDGKHVVHDMLQFYLKDWPNQQRVDISRFAWGQPKASDPALPKTHREEMRRGPSPLSSKFFEDLRAASKAPANREALQALLSKYLQPGEQFFIERELAIIHGNGDSRADHEVIRHLDKALPLAPTQEEYLGVLDARASVYERLGETLPALHDSLRVLLRCSYYDLAGEWSREIGSLRFAEPIGRRDETLYVTHRDHDEHDVAIRREADLRLRRHTAVGLVQRLRKKGLDDSAIQKALGFLSPDRRKDKVIMEWLNGENPFPRG